MIAAPIFVNAAKMPLDVAWNTFCCSYLHANRDRSMIQLDSILAATDLTVECTGVLQAAAALAQQADADLHIVHVAPEWDRKDPKPLKALEMQVARVLTDFKPTSVEVCFDQASHGILVHAAKVHADLVVLGPPRASSATARMQSTKAERIVKSAEVPCLVVRSPIASSLNRYGVLLDKDVSDRGLVDVLAAWAPSLGEAPEITFINASSAVLAPGQAAHVETGHGFSSSDPFGPIWQRAKRLLADCAELSSTSVSGPDTVSALSDWARMSAVQCLVTTTAARTGLKRIWSGSRAARLIQSAPCSVLLVPSQFWRREPIALESIAVAVAPESRDGRPYEWIAGRIQKAQQPIQQIDLSADGEVVEEAWTGGADLIVIDGQKDSQRRADALDPKVEDILEHTPVPVLVLRDLPSGPIDEVLVAVDTGDLWYEKFGWAKRLHDRFGSRITVFHAVDVSIGSRVRRAPGGEFVSGVSTWMKDDVERTVLPAMRAWIWERVRLAGLPEDAVDVKISMTDPWYAIPTLALTSGVDLVVVAAHSTPGPDPAPLSPVAKAVLTGGAYSVLAVVDRHRAVARMEAEHATYAGSEYDRS